MGTIVRRNAPLLALLIAACGVADKSAADIRVAGAWARATLPEQSASAVYLSISNVGGADDTLIDVTSSTGPAALHSTSMDSGIIRMRKVERLTIPARSTVRLEPAGAHLMLSGLDQPFDPGSTIDLTLRFQRSGERRIAATVRAFEGGK